jgi:5-methylcytosine-specific restriction endonuclease McrA
MGKYTIDIFTEKANKTHNNKYNYSLVEYVNSQVKIKIICPTHGIFEQVPNSHLRGVGCPKCYNKKRGLSQKLTTEIFIQKSKQLYSDEYNYNSVEYINAHIKVKIKCEKHGIFEQAPYSHLNGRGCHKCFRKTRDIIYLKENLTIEEDPIEIDNKIECRCAFCKKYFIPTSHQLKSRIRALSGKQKGENRLYCSDECKNLCPIFGQSLYPKGDKPYTTTSRPDQPELRQLVLERDNFQCQRCGSSEDLHCHHITGVEINPVESADVDNCITFCYACHSRVHSSDQCDVRRQPCVVKTII